jgi:hypothetical protein
MNLPLHGRTSSEEEGNGDKIAGLLQAWLGGTQT